MANPTAPTTFPRPGAAPSDLAVSAPRRGDQRWAGAPTAVVDDDGAIVLAHRLRDADGDRVSIARSLDGVRCAPVVTITARDLGVAMVERAAPVRTQAGWRLYVSCAEPGTRRWWIGLLEAPALDALRGASLRRLVLGGPLDAVKDPVVHRTSDGGWEAWVCCHPLDVAGAEDRMSTAYATSADGVTWRWHGTVLGGRPGTWDARGARVTSVLPDGRACYDGRASAEENWLERTGLADPVEGSRALRAHDGDPVADVRYLDVLPLPGGGHRLYYEARRPDGAHELRTELHI
jgi:hypothetical protein